MTALLVWILAVYGTTAIVTESKIFAPVRAWTTRRSAWVGSLLGCAMCFGFWCGATLSVLGWSPTSAAAPRWWPLALRVIADGAAAAGVCWGLAVLVGAALEARYALEVWRFREETRLAELQRDGSGTQAE